MRYFEVTALNKVDTTSYFEGDVFKAGKNLGILHNGKIETLVMKSDLKDYVKKSDVNNMIDEALKKVTK